jgi:tetratricopeptide (TPR) repeat protein
MLTPSLLQFIAFIALVILPISKKDNQDSTVQAIRDMKISAAITCTPDRETLNALIDEQEIYLLPGSGSYKWKIKTQNDSAQLYFNQGINTYYGFHIVESVASFKKASRFDPENPMPWWGLALAYGPNINDVGYSASPEALLAVEKALSLSSGVTDVERDLIKAMQARYSKDTTQTREELNQRYTDAMQEMYKKHNRVADVAALYADAMMLQHPWDLWEVSGTPKPWTPAIRAVLEKGLKTSPKHPGLNHYYIHVVEASPTPSKALASANVLGSVTPGLAHLVHMPSHIYLRIGQYNKGTTVNEEALKQYQQYAALFPAVSSGAFIYDLHNRHMLVNCAMHAGRYRTSIESANALMNVVDSATLFTPAPVGSLVQYIYMSPVLIHVRFEKWDSLLAMKPLPSNLVYGNILHHFGQGMARAGTNDTKKAREHVERIDELMKNEELKIEMKPFSAAIEGAKTARDLLVGYIHLKEKSFDKAIDHLTKALEVERQMVYNEPRDWFLNPGQYLGEAYLQAGNYAEAEKAFNMDLSVNAKNVWSLNGLYKAQQKQKKLKAASLTRKSLNEAASQADTDLLTFR